jgi:hypothetical protein
MILYAAKQRPNSIPMGIQGLENPGGGLFRFPLHAGASRNMCHPWCCTGLENGQPANGILSIQGPDKGLEKRTDPFSGSFT